VQFWPKFLVGNKKPGDSMSNFICMFLLLFSVSAFSAVETMFIFEHREDLATARENLGTEYPEIKDFRQVIYVGTYDTETKEILIQKSFAPTGSTAPPIIEPLPIPPATDIEPPVVICNPYEGTTRKEVAGLLQRIENFLNNQGDARAAFAGVASMFEDRESLFARIKAIRVLMYGCSEPETAIEE